MMFREYGRRPSTTAAVDAGRPKRKARTKDPDARGSGFVTFPKTSALDEYRRGRERPQKIRPHTDGLTARERARRRRDALAGVPEEGREAERPSGGTTGGAGGGV